MSGFVVLGRAKKFPTRKHVKDFYVVKYDSVRLYKICHNHVSVFLPVCCYAVARVNWLVAYWPRLKTHSLKSQ